MEAARDQPSAQKTGPVVGNDALAAALVDFARSIEQEKDPHAVLMSVVRAAIELVPGCDEASISVVLGRQKVKSGVASGDLASAVDALHERLQEGPGLDSAHEHTTVRLSDMATERRWPRFTAAARELGGVTGMLCCQLYVEGDDLGILNLLSRQAGAFTDESEHVGLMFAAHAAIAYSAALQQDRMDRGILTQRAIGQAQGILMERHKITADQAFTVLVRASQHANVKLRDLATLLTQTGELS